MMVLSASHCTLAEASAAEAENKARLMEEASMDTIYGLFYSGKMIVASGFGLLVVWAVEDQGLMPQTLKQAINRASDAHIYFVDGQRPEVRQQGLKSAPSVSTKNPKPPQARPLIKESDKAWRRSRACGVRRRRVVTAACSFTCMFGRVGASHKNAERLSPLPTISLQRHQLVSACRLLMKSSPKPMRYTMVHRSMCSVTCRADANWWSFAWALLSP